ncbi:MAG: rhodanese-like domain-containing protein [Gammaproteobacteria bacterium]|nr:rhodanese-like domain-containing protein [Gammaproteobacteria bacterium]
MGPSVITAAELADRLANRERDKPKPLVAQVTSPEAYAAGHVPGAVHVGPGDLVSGIPPATGRLPNGDALTTLFRRIGYTHGTEVVTLDDEGGGWAGRLAWTLDIIGNRTWRYLDGGLAAWVAAGLPIDRAPVDVTPSDVEITVDTGPIAEAEDIIPRLQDRDLVIWDCRSAGEFAGHRRAAVRVGHIPGAVNLDWLEVMDGERNLCLVEDLEALLAKKGIVPERDVITHCQTHHRSGLTYMAARLLGFPRIRAYHGSWSEWGNRMDTPVQTGPGSTRP